MPNVGTFIARWSPSGGAELSNSQLFLTELCDLLGLAHPDPFVSEVGENSYVFERPVSFDNGDPAVRRDAPPATALASTRAQ